MNSQIPLILWQINPGALKATNAFAALMSFIASLLAAIWALEMYRLLRTGAIGKSWKVFIAAAVLFMVHEITHVVRIFGFFDDMGLYETTKFIFVALLAYGFYMQRHIFYSPHLFRSVLNHRRPNASLQSESTEEEEEPAAAER